MNNVHTLHGFEAPASIAQKVAEALSQQIIYGDLEPGTRLVEDELVGVFGVSRSPVREALRVIEHEGLVVIESRRGARVAPLSAADLDEIYTCRLALEGLGAETAAHECTTEDAMRLHASLASLEHAHKADDPRAFFDANVALTTVIHEIARNETLSKLVRTISKKACRYRYLAYLKAPDLMDISINGNRDIVRAITEKRTGIARALTEDILRRSWARVFGLLMEKVADMGTASALSKHGWEGTSDAAERV